MSEQLYQSAWLTYLVTSAAFIVAWFWLTSGIRHPVISLLVRFPIIAIAFTPLSVDHVEEGVRYAPVIVALVVDGVAGNYSAMTGNFALLVVAMVLSLVFGYLWQRVRGRV